MSSTEDLTKLDLFDLLGVTEQATDSEIKKGFRQKALICHPDKNVGDPNAAEDFRRLSKAAEILLDASAKEAYIKLYRSRKERATRNVHLDGKRKQWKDDLEMRERGGRNEEEVNQLNKFAAEVERLRREGSSILEQLNESLRSSIKKEASKDGVKINKKSDVDDKSIKNEYSVRVSWDKEGLKSPEVLKLFNSFGPVVDCKFHPSGRNLTITYGDKMSPIRAFKSHMSQGFDVQFLDSLNLEDVTSACPNDMEFEDFEAMVLKKLKDKANAMKGLKV